MIRKFLKLLTLIAMMIPSLQATEMMQKKQPLVIIMLGPPGSGKGTQAQLLRDTLKIPHISTGDILRENIKKETTLGKEAKTYMEKGHLVPDDLILDMLFARVAQKDCDKGYILDGFPRTLAQAKAYDERRPKNVNVVIINLQLSDEIIIDRLSKRVVCEKCGTPYHLKDFPPKEEGKCDKCGFNLIQRPDDREDVVKNRLDVYHEQTAPLIAYYKKHEHFYSIDCTQSKEKIFEDIFAKLNAS